MAEMMSQLVQSRLEEDVREFLVSKIRALPPNRPALLFAWGDESDGRDGKDVVGYDARVDSGRNLRGVPGLRSIPITFGWSSRGVTDRTVPTMSPWYLTSELSGTRRRCWSSPRRPERPNRAGPSIWPASSW